MIKASLPSAGVTALLCAASASSCICARGIHALVLRDRAELGTEPGAVAQSDGALADHARRRLTCMWHPVGTCRTGRDHGSMVDPRLRVRGAPNLRVIDSKRRKAF